MNQCLTCNKITKNPKFCGSSCSAKFNNRGIRRHGNQPNLCLQCDNKLQGSTRKYCSHKCQNQHQYEQYISRWKLGLEDGSTRKRKEICGQIKRYIRIKFGEKCWECGWCKVNPAAGKVPVTIEHIDGNYTNNQENNLKLLCPNCHSLTSTYGALNKGHGRNYRIVTMGAIA